MWVIGGFALSPALSHRRGGLGCWKSNIFSQPRNTNISSNLKYTNHPSPLSCGRGLGRGQNFQAA
ncbi:hypothetical protein [Alysiella filiformis]|uniref:hypothetical protein n=1 Tax=Alysiella filiformis TaxID=194196 RepID=UPI001178C6B1|nr:hypothetical protein [Alysiella filiformis]